jgi:hypothetical protein
MLIRIVLTSPGETVEIIRAGSAEQHAIKVGLDPDGSISIVTENTVEVPGLGILDEAQLVAEHPGPIHVRWPL